MTTRTLKDFRLNLNFDKVCILLLSFFLIFSWAKKQNKVRVSEHYGVCTKKLVNIKSRKLSIFALKCNFLGPNWLKIWNLFYMRKKSACVWTLTDAF